MTDQNFYSLNQYLREHFHEKVYKLALHGGDSCPNRDGTAGYGGCIFCGEGSGSFASETINEAIGRLSQKHIGSRYIAYFQSYTATYRITKQLVSRMLEAAEDNRIAAISIGTRPDCLGADVMELLTELVQKKPVWVELGLQTIHPGSAAFIRRGYDLPVFEEAVKKLRSYGIDIIVHLILGLPGETKEQILESVKYLNRWDIQGVKLQLLHVLRGTDLGRMFEDGESKGNPEEYPFSLEEYAELIGECIRNLRPDIVVHRITGDAPKKDLLAPLWSADKKKVLNTIHQYLKQQKVRQGEEWQK
ncbi:MAG: TIGR01212 family radical SAM protein [Parasporobacterium sp.]|nr:TIGR01212 family radical SAM protein [Parasporobacterium sp.]